MFPFFFPAVPAAAKVGAVGCLGAGASCICSPLKAALYGCIGAFQGAMGAVALNALGYSVGSIAMAAAIGGAVGFAIVVPFVLVTGLKAFIGSDDKEDGFFPFLGRFGLDVGVMFLGSLVLSTAVMLGTLPAVAVGVGAAVTSLAKETVSYAMS